MILLIEILLITILVMIGITLVTDEVSRRKRTSHSVRLEGYWDGKERREATRHYATLDVDYRINHKFKPSRSKDISTHGLGLLLEEKLERKTPLTVEIKLNGVDKSITAKGKVMWSKETRDEHTPKRLFHTGIKFVRFANPAHEKKLFDYIKSIEKDMPQNLNSALKNVHPDTS